MCSELRQTYPGPPGVPPWASLRAGAGFSCPSHLEYPLHDSQERNKTKNLDGTVLRPHLSWAALPVASCRGSCDRPGAQQVEGGKVMSASLLPPPLSLGQSGGEVRSGTAGPSFRVLTCRQRTEGPEPWKLVKLGNREKGVPTAQHRAGDALGWVLRRGGGPSVHTQAAPTTPGRTPRGKSSIQTCGWYRGPASRAKLPRAPHLHAHNESSDVSKNF